MSVSACVRVYSYVCMYTCVCVFVCVVCVRACVCGVCVCLCVCLHISLVSNLSSYFPVQSKYVGTGHADLTK